MACSKWQNGDTGTEEGRAAPKERKYGQFGFFISRGGKRCKHDGDICRIQGASCKKKVHGEFIQGGAGLRAKDILKLLSFLPSLGPLPITSNK